MRPLSPPDPIEKLSGVVERITYHNEQNGWTVLKVAPFREPGRLVTVVVHQAKVFAGATMEFHGVWSHHPQHGEQFKASHALEKKPATTAALEKYLGSGLIKGVGPVTAARIVRHFKEKTLAIFEENIEALKLVPGIADKKLEDIRVSWAEHKSIREVMIFLQDHGISTLFAVKIFKTYGDRAIEQVTKNPYRLARDIYGIGFFSADKIALSMGFERNGLPRIEAGIKHVLASSREEGHCYLTSAQIQIQVRDLLGVDEPDLVQQSLLDLLASSEIKKRIRQEEQAQPLDCYYSKSLYYDEDYVAKKIAQLLSESIEIDLLKVKDWVARYCAKELIVLSDEQQRSVIDIAASPFSVLTGGPGCGKTTSTKVLVKLLKAMKKTILLAAPTGRAAQRMSEVIGQEAKTIHRLLEWNPTAAQFKKGEQDPLSCDFLIVDECSMLDISLTASLLKAVKAPTQVLFIGDPDQLPSVGAGNVLFDLLLAGVIPTFQLTKIFRQAESSHIIRYAHKINQGEVPFIDSPIADPELFQRGVDCAFLDAEEATQDQAKFIARVKGVLRHSQKMEADVLLEVENNIKGKAFFVGEELHVAHQSGVLIQREDLLNDAVLRIPENFLHVELKSLFTAEGAVDELKAVLKKVHPWSTLHHGLTAVDTILRLYTKTIPDLLGLDCEIQVLTPQIRGTLGTINLNQQIQATVNPSAAVKKQMTMGERIYRVGDRVIQTRNNYDLGVFNGDIGIIEDMDLENLSCVVHFSSHETPVNYERENLVDLQLAYAITIHKSQGSEFQAVVIPVATQHFKMLFRNLIYTGLTRGKKLVIFVGSRKALALAIQTMDQKIRQTSLPYLLRRL